MDKIKHKMRKIYNKINRGVPEDEYRKQTLDLQKKADQINTEELD